jgi:hypothetical protein
MGEIVEQDFGKKDRDAARSFARLLHLVNETEADILANPGKYLDMAAAELVKARRLTLDLYKAIQKPICMRPDWTPPDRMEVLYIDKEEYERWQRVQDIVRTAFNS